MTAILPVRASKHPRRTVQRFAGMAAAPSITTPVAPFSIARFGVIRPRTSLRAPCGQRRLPKPGNWGRPVRRRCASCSWIRSATPSRCFVKVTVLGDRCTTGRSRTHHHRGRWHIAEGDGRARRNHLAWPRHRPRWNHRRRHHHGRPQRNAGGGLGSKIQGQGARLHTGKSAARPHLTARAKTRCGDRLGLPARRRAAIMHGFVPP